MNSLDTIASVLTPVTFSLQEERSRRERVRKSRMDNDLEAVDMDQQGEVRSNTGTARLKQVSVGF